MKNGYNGKSGSKEFSVITMDDLHKAISFLYGTGAFANVNYAPQRGSDL